MTTAQVLRKNATVVVSLFAIALLVITAAYAVTQSRFTGIEPRYIWTLGMFTGLAVASFVWAAWTYYYIPWTQVDGVTD